VEIQKLEKEEFKESKKEKAKRIGFWVLKILAFTLSFVLATSIYYWNFWILIFIWALFSYFEFCYLKPLSGYFLFITFVFTLYPLGVEIVLLIFGFYYV